MEIIYFHLGYRQMHEETDADGTSLRRPKRPVRSAFVIFGVLALLFLVFGPFADIDPYAFIIGGIAYSGILAFVAVGSTLASPTLIRVKRRLLLLMHLLPPLSMLAILAVLLTAGPGVIFSVNLLVRVLLVLVALALAAFVIIAISGWVCFIRQEHSTMPCRDLPQSI